MFAEPVETARGLAGKSATGGGCRALYVACESDTLHALSRATQLLKPIAVRACLG